MRVRDPHPSGLTAQLFDIYHPSDAGAEQALLEGLDYAEKPRIDAAWLLGNDTQLDAGVNFGLNRATSDAEFYFGVSRRF